MTNHPNHPTMKHVLTLLTAALVLSSCGKESKEYDATGTFEATEITVSAEAQGRLLTFAVEEGDKVQLGTEVCIVDTTQLHLKALQLGSAKQVYASQRPDTQKQIAVTRQQLEKARQDLARYAALVADGAANRKLQDDAESQVRVLERQLAAQISTLGISTNSLNAQMSTTDVQRAQVADQLLKCRVTAPVTGTILEKYAECGEYAAPGKPLFKIADTDHMFLRAYITTAQLERVKIGQKVKVMADYGNGNRKAYGGRVTWISQKAEFTPKTILTDDERADLVYAVKIAVSNDGFIKIGMYGEVVL